MVDDACLEVLAAFARHVDCNASIRQAIRDAADLKTIAQIAKDAGFELVTAQALAQACLDLCTNKEWIWNPMGRRWSDHMFALALVTLIEDKEIDADNCELFCFYNYLAGCKVARQEFLSARSTWEQVLVARSHGFLVSEASFQVREIKTMRNQP